MALRETCAVQFFKEKQDTFVNIQCPVCDVDGNFIYFKYGFSHDKCQKCCTVWCNPRPTEASLVEYYATSESAKMWTSILVSTDTSRKQLQYQPRVDSLIATLKQDLSFIADKAVDLGAGSGAFALCLQNKDYFSEVIAIDFDEDCVNVCKQLQLKAMVGSVDQIEEGSANLITMNDMIEHLFDPKDFLERCYSSLANNGYISIACPNGEGFDFKLMGENTVNIVPPEHLNYFNPDSLSMLLVKAGFQIVAVETPGILDVEIVKREFKAGNLSLDNNMFLKTLMSHNDDAIRRQFQSFLQVTKQSSHMVVIAKKNL
ncbi:MAG: class I SAM-dependent methyltransferase [Candidatus Cloacimonetes bacterium]|nr:class I SAM-dependent methyltransferase [Candidatus Cloacimonadota bacterium]